MNKENLLLDGVMEVEKSAWPPELRASKEKFASRLRVFPDGFFVVKEKGGIRGVTTSLITTYDPLVTRTWDEITDNGMIEKTHNPRGNALYVASVAVATASQGQGIGGKLVGLQIDLTKQLGLKYLFLGARIPGYDSFCRRKWETSVEDYLKIKNAKNETLDPEIRFYERQGLRVAGIIPNFEPDLSSRNFGITMLWENLDL